MSGRGFTLVELLIAAVLCTLVVGAALAAVHAARALAGVAPAAAEINQRLRSGIDRLTHDLREAGADPEIAGPELPRLGALTAVVRPLPALDGEEPPADGRSSAMTLTTVSRLAAQGRLRAPMAHETDALRLEMPPACPSAVPPCGFQAGDPVVIFDHTGHITFDRIAAADPLESALYLEAPVDDTYDRGAVVAGIEITTYGLRRDTVDGGRLVRITGAGAEQPVIDHVLAVAFSAEGARTSVALTVEAAAARLRGPGAAFAGAGRAQVIGWVPSIEVRFAVSRR